MSMDLLQALIDPKETPKLFGALHLQGAATTVIRSQNSNFVTYMQIFRSSVFFDYEDRIPKLRELFKDIERTITSVQKGGACCNDMPIRTMEGCGGFEVLNMYWLRQPFLLDRQPGMEWIAECCCIPRILDYHG
jgi:hypothetical protein